jgi:hypothetical protein
MFFGKSYLSSSTLWCQVYPQVNLSLANEIFPVFPIWNLVKCSKISRYLSFEESDEQIIKSWDSKQ